ncbi:MAG TPA: tRNA (adenosine(37)-N6)-dimethylallyltransferase MiaA [Bryobacteraceae bacterium]|nr:tRNA (adenosine(37)-N6)-dimethylallyltransferase MiaA [Bryobacteraceae bacterium]
MPETILQKPLIAIVGPTGAGKSALALKIAETFPGEIVNCDSLQIYRGFDIGAAKTPASERRGIAHHLIDVVDPGAVYSAGDYARDARRIIREISARGHLPIISGGTGFYLRALLDGLPHLPGRDQALRERLASRDRRRPGSLHRILSRLDPQAASRIHVRDTQKLMRALEIRILTREAAPPRASAEAFDGYRTLKIGLDPDRAELYEFLDARAAEMFRSGLIEEIRRLLDRGLTGREKPFESLGYRQGLEYVRGSMTLQQAIATTQLETRQYAKRQWTWFRRDAQVRWLRGFGNAPSVVEKCLEMIRTFIFPSAF